VDTDTDKAIETEYVKPPMMERQWQKRGRPHVYNPAVQIKADYYVKHHEAIGDSIPSFAGLAVYLELGKKTVQNWSNDIEKYPAFVDTIERIRAKQEAVLISKGLDGTFNAAITKLVLHQHGYHEKTQTELTGANGGAIDTTWNVQVRAVDSMKQVNVIEQTEFDRKDNVIESQNASNCDKIDPLLREDESDRDIPNSNISPD